MIQYDSYFSNGLKPPTSDGLIDCFWIFQKFLEQTCILDFYLARCLVPQLDQWTKRSLRIWQSYHHFHVPIRTRSSSRYTAGNVDSPYVIGTPEKLRMSIFRRLKFWMTISEPKLKGILVPSCYSNHIHVLLFHHFFGGPKIVVYLSQVAGQHFSWGRLVPWFGQVFTFCSQWVCGFARKKEKQLFFFVGNDDLKHWNSYFLFAPSKPWQSLMGCDGGKGANFIQLKSFAILVEHFKSSP